MAVLSDSNIKSWLQEYARFKDYGDVLFIPGHGEPAPLKAFDFPTRSYLQMLFSYMSTMVDQGVDLQDAIDKLDQKAYSRLANYEALSGRNASWAYIEREKAFFNE